MSRRLSLSVLSDLCRRLHQGLSAGLPLPAVLRHLESSPRLRPLANALRPALLRGDSWTAAFRQAPQDWPPLFLALVEVGEQTGRLTDIFAELERYYQQQHRWRRHLLQRSLVPLVQLFLAGIILGLTLWLIGLLAASRGMVLFGIGGPQTAGRFLLGVGAVLLVLGVLFFWARLWRRALAAWRGWRRLPLLGPCLEALALGRFAQALRLALDSGLPAEQAWQLSVTAGGPLLQPATLRVQQALRRGQSWSAALSASRLFPQELLQVLAVGEASGQLPEVLARQAQQFADDAERRLEQLLRLLVAACWLLYASFAIFAIFRLARGYLEVLHGTGL